MLSVNVRAITKLATMPVIISSMIILTAKFDE